MQRLRSDRGAVAVMTALLLVPLLVCAALVVDIGSDYVQLRQLQNAADAAALAIAEDCGKGACGDYGATAVLFTKSNLPDRDVSATTRFNKNSANRVISVTVRTSEKVSYAFGPVIGVNANIVATEATASWGTPSGGIAILPLTISRCSLDAQTKDAQGLPAGTVVSTIALSKTAGVNDCTGPSGNAVPGGFGWLQPGVGCTAPATLATTPANKDTGRSEPLDCDVPLKNQLGKTILIPVFDGINDQGQYLIYGYAAFVLTSYNFVHFDGFIAPDKRADCDVYKNRCLRGYFLKFVDLSGAFTDGADSPNLGAQVVTLTTPPPQVA